MVTKTKAADIGTKKFNLLTYLIRWHILSSKIRAERMDYG
jgi:hypothetical protein